MTTTRSFALLALVLVLLSGCTATDETAMSFEQTSAMAAELEQMLGLRPSISSRWSDDRLDEVKVEFPAMPAGLTCDAVIETVQRLLAIHFDQAPQRLTLAFTLTAD